MTGHAPPLTAAPAPRYSRLVLTLALAGLLSGLLLVAVYEVTLGPITANREAALRSAVLEVIPGSTAMQPLVYRDGTFTPVAKPDPADEVIYAGYDDAGAFLGYAITGDGPGFQDIIALIYGYSPEKRTTTGLYILESRETPGLGDKIFKDQVWVDAFRTLAVDPELEAVKDGAATPNEVDAITGATISSVAVVKIINAANAVWLDRLPEPGSEPALVVTGQEETP